MFEGIKSYPHKAKTRNVRTCLYISGNCKKAKKL